MKLTSRQKIMATRIEAMLLVDKVHNPKPPTTGEHNVKEIPPR